MVIDLIEYLFWDVTESALWELDRMYFSKGNIAHRRTDQPPETGPGRMLVHGQPAFLTRAGNWTSVRGFRSVLMRA